MAHPLRSNYLAGVCLFCSLLCGGTDVTSAATFTTRESTRAGALVFATAPRQAQDRMFLLDKAGTIRVLDQSTQTLLPDPFLSIPETEFDGEKGLLGLAFHPEYATNGLFYVYVSVDGGTQNHLSQVRQYKALGDPQTATQADPASMQLVLQFPQPFSNHNGGWLGFSPVATGDARDYLYIATGDGGSGGDPNNNAQTTTNNWLGKMLRVDIGSDQFPDDTTRNYAVPSSNPFVGQAGDDEIWAYGLRNPWRNSFDRETGDLWIADVGQGVWEEINFQPADSVGGQNYGWRVKEGPACFSSQPSTNPLCTDPVLVAPVHAYPHGDGPSRGNSVTGGYVYRGSVPEFQGLYFFADFVKRNFWTLDPYAKDISASVVNRNAQLVPLAGTIGSISSFGEDANGELYVAGIASGLFKIGSDAETATWRGDASDEANRSDWLNPENWSRAGIDNAVVVAHDAVVLPADSQSHVLQLFEPQVIGSLTVADDFLVQGESLQVLSGQVTVTADGSLSIKGGLSAETSASSIRKLGPGRLHLDGTATQVALLEGTLGGNGSIDYVKAFAGTVVSPGDGLGQLSIHALEISPAATLRMDIAGTSAALFSDRIISESAELSGRLEIVPAADYADPVSGAFDTFTLVTGTVTSDFQEFHYHGQAINLGHQGEGLFRWLELDDVGLSWLNYQAMAGDANGDRIVSFPDFVALANGFGQSGDWTTGDFDGDGAVQFVDFVRLANNFGKSLLPQAATTQSVPEPIPGTLLPGMGFVLLIVRRRRN